MLLEDGSKIMDPLPGDEIWGFFGVYDGHGGREAVDYCELRLHEQVVQEMKSLRPNEALRSAFQKIDSQLGSSAVTNTY